MSRFPSLAELRSRAQPDDVLARRNAEHWAGKYYLRHLSIHVTRLLIPTGISANGVTWIMVFAGVVGAGVLIIPSPWALLGCAMLMQVQVLVDCSDGEVARWRGTSSAVGIYIDRLGHYFTEALLPVGFGIHVDGGVNHIGMNTMLGLVVGLIVLFNKSFGDLVHTSRASYGLPPLQDDGAKSAPKPSGLRAIRAALGFVPFFRAFVAIEYSLILLTVGMIDRMAGSDGDLMKVALIAMIPLAVIILVGRLIAILTSDRLKV